MPAIPNRLAAAPVAAVFLMLATAGFGVGSAATAQASPVGTVQVADHLHADGARHKKLCSGCRKESR